jgi:flagellar assembly protein FliH
MLHRAWHPGGVRTPRDRLPDTAGTLASPLSSFGVLFVDDFEQPATEAGGTDDTTPPPAAVSPPPAPSMFTSADLQAARQEGAAEGQSKALAQFRAEGDELCQQVLGTIAERLAEARQESVRLAEDAAAALARLLMQTLRTLLPATTQRCGENEVRALTRAILPGLAQEPHVQIRISPLLAPAIEAELTALEAEARARIVLAPTETIPPGDARIIWQDGSASRDTAAIWNAVAEVLAPLGLFDMDCPPATSTQPRGHHA